MMRTPEDWKREYPELLSKELISEIQRDAREGTVPVEDIRPLLIQVSMLIEDGNAAPHTAWLADDLAAKHPQLFVE